MRTRFIAAALLLTVADGFAQDVVQNEIERAKESLADVIAQTAPNAEVFDTNGFHAVASDNAQLGAGLTPDGYRFQHVQITAARVFRVEIEKGARARRAAALSVSHRDTREPMLSAADRDGDAKARRQSLDRPLNAPAGEPMRGS